MNRKYRKTIVAGNWKMHKTATETKLFAERLKGALPRVKRCSIVLCVPYVDIPAAVKILKDSRVAVGAQNLHWETSGPYTGEVSAAMLADLDVKYVIIGHSERRALFGETDLTINKKLHAALDAGLRPILCVGEDLEQRELGVTLEFISYQLKAALAGVTRKRCAGWSSPMSPSGPLAPATPPPRSRPVRSVPPSAGCCGSSTAPGSPGPPPSSMGAP